MPSSSEPTIAAANCCSPTNKPCSTRCDVDTAIDAYAAQQNRLRHLAEALTAARRALTLATERFERGLTDSLNVIDAQRQEYAIEEQYVLAQQSAAADFVSLYKSLGAAGRIIKSSRPSGGRSRQWRQPSEVCCNQAPRLRTARRSLAVCALRLALLERQLQCHEGRDPSVVDVSSTGGRNWAAHNRLARERIFAMASLGRGWRG